MNLYDICVIGGGGHVGLPLSIAFANAGKKVAIYDVNDRVVDVINRGHMPFMESGADVILKKVIKKNLIATKDPSVISKSKFLVVVIGTPVDDHLNPEYRLVKNLFGGISSYLRNNQIIIMRSTLYPGTTEKIQGIVKTFNKNIEVCFCPERIAEGQAMKELYSLPQIVAGFNKKTVQKVQTLFRCLTKDIIVTSPLEAELAKLFTNSFRYIQFAIANQFFMISEEYGANFYNVFNAMVHNYPRTKGFPRAGLTAGPCLFKDTMQISAFTSNKFFLGHSAMLVNEGLPNFIVERMKLTLPLHEKCVGILGMAFKADSDDKRESLSYKLKKILDLEARSVICSDSFIRDEGFVTEKELIDKSDVIVIGAPHSHYKSLNFMGKKVIDIWDFLKIDSGKRII